MVERAMLRLKPSQLLQLRNLLRVAFTEDDFEDLLLSLDQELNDFAGKSSSYPTKVREAVRIANSRLWWRDLLRQACNAAPVDGDLCAFAAKFGFAPQIVAAGSDSVIPLNGRSLEIRIRETQSTYPIVSWRQKLAEIEGCVCRIEYPEWVARGTGLLVGPRMVMTNYHVIELLKTGQIDPKKLVVRFDFKMLDNGVSVAHGRTCGGAVDWLADYSPYSARDFDSEPAIDPADDELDYALLRLNARPSDDQLDNGVARGWIAAPTEVHTFDAKCALYIVQHPNGKPMQIALDSDGVISWSATRVRYATTTEPGSSGSPCFDANWNWIALHHSGDPDYWKEGRKPNYKQGIPVSAILRLLKQRNLFGLLGAEPDICESRGNYAIGESKQSALMVTSHPRVELPAVGRPPTFRRGKRFVGRRGMLRELLAFASALRSSEEHYQLRWYCGFGGLGKTEFVRAFCQEVSRQDREIQIGLIDFNPEEPHLHHPGGTLLYQPLDLLDVIAWRVAQLYGVDSLIEYWKSRANAHANEHCRAALADDFGIAAQVLVERGVRKFSEPTAGMFGEASTDRAVRFLDELIRDAKPRNATLQSKDMLAQIFASPREKDRLFRAWARRTHPDRASWDVLDCYSRAAEALTTGLHVVKNKKPLLLVIDTHERLNLEQDHLLFQVLNPLLDGHPGFGLVIVSRHRPTDRDHWLSVSERLRKIQTFDENTNLTTGDICEAIRTAVSSQDEVEALSNAVSQVTQGMPLLVGMLVDKLEENPKAFHDWDLPSVDDIAGPSENVWRELLEKLADRVLLHVNNTGPFQRDSDFSLVLALTLLGPKRSAILEQVWGDFQKRLHLLRQAHSFVRGDGLHEEVRKWLRAHYRRNPHPWIGPLVAELRRAHISIANDGNFDADHLLECANLASWDCTTNAIAKVAPYMTISMARSQNLKGFMELLQEFPEDDGSTNLLKTKLLRWRELFPWLDPDFNQVSWLLDEVGLGGWPAAAEDHARIVVGLSRRHGPSREVLALLLQASKNLGQSTPRAKRVVDRLAELAFEAASAEHVRAVVCAARVLRLSPVPKWRELAYREHDRIVAHESIDAVRNLQQRLRQQIDALREFGNIPEAQPFDREEGPLVLVLAHLLSRHDCHVGESEELLRGATADIAMDSANLLQAELFAALVVNRQWNECQKFLDDVGVEVILNSGVWPAKVDLSVPGATALFERIVGAATLECDDASNAFGLDTAVFLSIASHQLANIGIQANENRVRAQQMLQHISHNQHQFSASKLNSAAWKLYLADSHLDIAKELAESSLSRSQPTDVYALQTLAAICVSTGAWDEAKQHILCWSKVIDCAHLQKSWHSFLAMFDEIHAQGRSEELISLLDHVGRPDVWLPVIDAFKSTGSWPRALGY